MSFNSELAGADESSAMSDAMALAAYTAALRAMGPFETASHDELMSALDVLVDRVHRLRTACMRHHAEKTPATGRFEYVDEPF